MNDDAFARLVAEEVKNRVSRAQKEFLHMPDNWTRWQRALVSLCENLQNQVTNLKSDQESDRRKYAGLGPDGVRLLAEAMSDYENRQSKIERFKFHVEKRLDEVTRMIAMGVEQADTNIALAAFLRKAISTHRDMLHNLDIEPTSIDEALWSSLDGNWTFDHINLSEL